MSALVEQRWVKHSQAVEGGDARFRHAVVLGEKDALRNVADDPGDSSLRWCCFLQLRQEELTQLQEPGSRIGC